MVGCGRTTNNELAPALNLHENIEHKLLPDHCSGLTLFPPSSVEEGCQTAPSSYDLKH